LLDDTNSNGANSAFVPTTHLFESAFLSEPHPTNAAATNAAERATAKIYLKFFFIFNYFHIRGNNNK